MSNDENTIAYYRQELIALRRGIIDNATDTVWSGPGETAVDAITRILDDHAEFEAGRAG